MTLIALVALAAFTGCSTEGMRSTLRGVDRVLATGPNPWFARLEGAETVAACESLKARCVRWESFADTRGCERRHADCVSRVEEHLAEERDAERKAAEEAARQQREREQQRIAAERRQEQARREQAEVERTRAAQATQQARQAAAERVAAPGTGSRHASGLVATDVFIAVVMDERFNVPNYFELRWAAADTLEEADGLKRLHFAFSGTMPRDRIVKCSDIEPVRVGWMATAIANLPKSGFMPPEHVPRVKVGIACGQRNLADAVRLAYAHVLRESGGNVSSLKVVAGVSAKADFAALKNPHNGVTAPFVWTCSTYSEDAGFPRSVLASPQQLAQVLVDQLCAPGRSLTDDMTKLGWTEGWLGNVPRAFRADRTPEF